MYSFKFLLLALSLATFTFGLPASPSEDPNGPFIIKNLQTRYKNNLQYIRFSITDLRPQVSPPDHGDVAPETVGHCAAVMNDDGVLLELLPEEFERSWDSLAEEDRPEAGQYQPSTDSLGFVECTADFSFRVIGNMALSREGNIDFEVLLQHEFSYYSVGEGEALENTTT